MPHLLRHGTSVFKVISERPVIVTSKCQALGEGAITTYFHVLGLTRPCAEHGARTHDLPITRRELYQLSHRDRSTYQSMTDFVSESYFREPNQDFVGIPIASAVAITFGILGVM